MTLHFLLTCLLALAAWALLAALWHRDTPTDLGGFDPDTQGYREFITRHESDQSGMKRRSR